MTNLSLTPLLLIAGICVFGCGPLTDPGSEPPGIVDADADAGCEPHVETCKVTLRTTWESVEGVELATAETRVVPYGEDGAFDLALGIGRYLSLSARGEAELCIVGVGFSDPTEVPTTGTCAWERTVLFGLLNAPYDRLVGEGMGILVRDRTGSNIYQVLVLKDEVKYDAEGNYAGSAVLLVRAAPE